MLRWPKKTNEKTNEPEPIPMVITATPMRKFFVVKADVPVGQDWAGRPGFIVREDQLTEMP